MTLIKIIERIQSSGYENIHGDLWDDDEWKELKSRIEFIDGLIEDGLDLDDNFILSYIWKGE